LLGYAEKKEVTLEKKNLSWETQTGGRPKLVTSQTYRKNSLLVENTVSWVK
jgi:hypothetical protein